MEALQTTIGQPLCHAPDFEARDVRGLGELIRCFKLINLKGLL